MVKKQLRPDSRLGAAVDSVTKNKEFSRMLAFGLRSLTGLVCPPTMRAMDNAIESINLGITPSLVESINNSDEEVIRSSALAFSGLTNALRTWDDDEVTKRFVREGGMTAIISGLKLSLQDISIKVDFAESLRELQKSGVELPAAAFNALLGVIDKDKLKPEPALMIAELLESLGQRKDVRKTMQPDAPATITEFLIHAKYKDQSAIWSKVVSQFLRIEGHIASVEHAGAVIDVLELYRTDSAVQSSGSDCLATLVGPDDLKKCLSDIKSSNETARSGALATLAAMSYISQYAQAIVEAGVVPTLVKAIAEFGRELHQQHEGNLIKGIKGAARMIATVARNPSNHKILLETEPTSAVVETMMACEDDDLLAVLASSLVPLLSLNYNQLLILKSSGCLNLVIKQLACSKSADVRQACAGVLEVYSGIGEEAVSELIEADVVKTCFEILSETRCPLTAGACCGILHKCVTHDHQTDRYLPFLQVVSKLMDSFSSDPRLAEKLSDLAKGWAQLEGVKDHDCGQLIDSCLTLAFIHQTSSTVTTNVGCVLAVLATERD
ncbi:MAG: uncharacterized protein KVP18_000896, partial [Porospora cf. gigantea A]|uniref:uncharacterized protein n=1 Tax=Porospora cf. gigantea A TaxID=2853593 RepID=UPI00355AAE71